MGKGIKMKDVNGNEIFPCPYYPVGSIYMSVLNVNPTNYFGGEWEQIKDVFLLAGGDTYEVGSTGGEATHKLTVDEMPSHTHAFNKEFSHSAIVMREGNGAGDSWDVYIRNSGANINYRRVMALYGNLDTGGSEEHNNMPPYLAIYVWKRIK